MNSDTAPTLPRTPVDLAGARRAVREGGAVVLPNPAPLTHVVTATRPEAVNESKGRPAGQPVALWAHAPETLRTVTACTPLDTTGAALAARLLAEEHLTLLLPLSTDARPPAWLAPATKDGWVLLFGARWHPLVPLLDDHPVLYVSSANRTGHRPAATPVEAMTMFPEEMPVLHLPRVETELRPSDARRATTTLTLHPDGRPTLHRQGAQDAPFPTPDAYLDDLRVRYGASTA
ncbi:Sua5/YciO/YrdC/YwlC family protein [Streptomyces sp. NBC_00083]|uniref:Sua5/YciO/YrdC/YwlC family protein n=1 Tax=Streptomyces sp. NBC_00083 TaxID=2975647 RepID=UPI00225AE097|nr:Sua5/YciO/YrdC/YwlC family protein [Streptomyces sp. NBC_00083]MCX5384879.1 Sua5/YciO/YrdC/YwlC family protein [Streptomyces sp. NBC_00083]